MDKGGIYKLETILAQRVAKIISLTEKEQRKHDSSEETPADLVSRGTQTNLLLNETCCGMTLVGYVIKNQTSQDAGQFKKIK